MWCLMLITLSDPLSIILLSRKLIFQDVWGQEVKDQGYVKPEIDFEAWRRHHFNPPPLGPVGFPHLILIIRLNPLMRTLKPQSNGPLYRSVVIGTLAVDEWAITFDTARRGLGRLRPRPVTSLLYQMLQPTHQQPVYKLYIIWCGTIIACGL